MKKMGIGVCIIVVILMALVGLQHMLLNNPSEFLGLFLSNMVEVTYDIFAISLVFAVTIFTFTLMMCMINGLSEYKKKALDFSAVFSLVMITVLAFYQTIIFR